MTEESDWKAWATLDRDLLVKDIMELLDILKRQRVYCIVSASDRIYAQIKAKDHLAAFAKIPRRYIKSLKVRRLPT